MKPDLRKRSTMSDKNKAYQEARKQKAAGKWFAVLAKRREKLKWREVAAFFGLDTASAFRMATQARELELNQNE